MANNRDAATKGDIEELENQIKSNKLAIGFILASLSKHLDLKPVFEDALQEAERLNATFTTRKAISSIRDTVQIAEDGQTIEQSIVVL